MRFLRNYIVKSTPRQLNMCSKPFRDTSPSLFDIHMYKKRCVHVDYTSHGDIQELRTTQKTRPWPRATLYTRQGFLRVDTKARTFVCRNIYELVSVRPFLANQKLKQKSHCYVL